MIENQNEEQNESDRSGKSPECELEGSSGDSADGEPI